MELKQLEAFCAVVEYQSFSEAAKHLYLSQPTISAHVKSLEQELNSRLVIRTTQRVSITERGYRLYEVAQSMLKMRSNIIEEFNSKDRKIIELSASTIPSSYILPEILADFNMTSSNIHFHIDQSDSHIAIQRVAENMVDLGFVGMTEPIHHCEFVPFCTDSMVIAAPVNEHYLQLKETDYSIEDFLDDPFIMREQGSGSKKDMDRYLEAKGIDASRLKIVARMNDLVLIKKSIVNGMGISIISEASVHDMQQTNQMVLFPLEPEAFSRTYYIVYNKNRILKPYVKQFMKYCINHENK